MNNQFTPRVSDIITYSKEEANRLNSPHIGSEHLLLGLLREGTGKAYDSLVHLQIDLGQMKSMVENNIRTKYTPCSDENISFNVEASRILKLCILEAKLLKCEMADAEHMLLAMLKQQQNEAANVLGQFGLTYDKVLNSLSLTVDKPRSGFGLDEEDEEEDERTPFQQPKNNPSGDNFNNYQTQTAKTSKPTFETPILDNFSMDLTKAAEEGKLDPVVGRE